MDVTRMMRSTVLAALLVAVLAIPALAATETFTSTFVNQFGNTVTVESTFVDGVLTTQTATETRPDGSVVVERTWEYYPSGALQTYEEWRHSPISPTHLYQEYSEDGILLYQEAEMYLNGEPAMQSITTYDANGFLVSQEDRVLVDNGDGTKYWEVTTSTYSDGTLVSTETTQYPYGYDFDNPEQEQAREQRPGYGYGDKNHDQTGPPGKAAGAANAANGGGPMGDPKPGHGYGDRNHEHTGPPGK